jgi:hypothetical protein
MARSGDGISSETGLLAAWPAGAAAGMAGDRWRGYASLSVARGRLYTQASAARNNWSWRST